MPVQEHKPGANSGESSYTGKGIGLKPPAQFRENTARISPVMNYSFHVVQAFKPGKNKNTVAADNALTSVGTNAVVQRFGQQVEPDDEPQLVNHIVNYRLAQNYHQYGFAHGEHNVAVAFNGWETDHSHNGRHGEENLDIQIMNLYGNRNGVNRIHTEREPCDECEVFLTNNYINPGILAENDITWWAGYQLPPEERKKEKVALRDTVMEGVERKGLMDIDGSQSRFGRVRNLNPRLIDP